MPLHAALPFSLFSFSSFFFTDTATTEIYTLSLHDALPIYDSSGERVLGFDNAHPIKSKKRGRYIARKIVYDHKHTHSSDEGTPYTFESAEQLLEDFFAEVDKILMEKK